MNMWSHKDILTKMKGRHFGEIGNKLPRTLSKYSEIEK